MVKDNLKAFIDEVLLDLGLQQDNNFFEELLAMTYKMEHKELTLKFLEAFAVTLKEYRIKHIRFFSLSLDLIGVNVEDFDFISKLYKSYGITITLIKEETLTKKLLNKFLVKRLISEHNKIKSFFKKIKVKEIEKNKLEEFRNFLKDHMDKEEKFVYPLVMLDSEFSIVKLYASNMEVLSENVNEFFSIIDKMIKNDEDISEVIEIFKKLILKRIEKEEDIIFKVFELGGKDEIFKEV